MTDKDAAERLAEATGRDKENFTAEEYDLPKLDDLDKVHFVPVSELEELVEEYEEQMCVDAAMGNMDAADRLEQVLNSLEELVEEHKH